MTDNPIRGRWTWQQVGRQQPRWHISREVPNNSGSVYTWETLCVAHVGPAMAFAPKEGQAPMEGAPICRECRRRRVGLARWEETPQAGDWMAVALEVR